MGRLLRFAPRYAEAYKALRKNPAARFALVKTARRLESSNTLPLPEDFEVLRWPVGVAWARKVSGARLWVLYDFDDESVTLQDIRREKPVEVDG